jgi:hypothetical protein
MNKPSLVIKALLVIESCKTLDHIDAAERYLYLCATYFDIKLNFEFREKLLQKQKEIIDNCL